MATGNYYPSLITFSDVTSIEDDMEPCSPFLDLEQGRYFFDMPLLNTAHGLSNVNIPNGGFLPDSTTGSHSALVSIGHWGNWLLPICGMGAGDWVDFSPGEPFMYVTGYASVENDMAAYPPNPQAWEVNFGDWETEPRFFSATIDLTSYADAEVITVSTINGYGEFGSSTGMAIVEFRNYDQFTTDTRKTPYRETNKRCAVPMQIKPAWINGSHGGLSLNSSITPGYRRVSLRAVNTWRGRWSWFLPDGQTTPFMPMTLAGGLSQSPSSNPTNTVSTVGSTPPLFPTATPTFTAGLGPNGQVMSTTPLNPGGTSTTPSITTASPPGVTATASACSVGQPFGNLLSITVSNGGTGYTQPPTVTISGGGGSGATAIAVVDPGTGAVISIQIQNGGSGYTSTNCPTVTFSNPGRTSSAGACTIIAGTVTNITISNGGTGYTQTPTVTFNNSGTGGSGATAIAIIDSTGTVTGITITNGGSGYQTCPTVTFSSPKQTATLTPLTNGGGTVGIFIPFGGTGYTNPPVVNVTIGPPASPVTTPAPPPNIQNPFPFTLPRQPSPAPNYNPIGYDQACVWVASPPNWFAPPGPPEPFPLQPYPTGIAPPPPPHGERPAEEIKAGICNYHKRHGKRSFIYNPYGIAPFQDRERRFELRGIGDGGTAELYGAIKIHQGLFFPFSRHQLFFSTFKYRSIDTNNADAVSTAATRIRKDLGSYRGAAWEVASFEDCFENAVESQLRDFLRKFGIIHNDIPTTDYSFIRLIGMLTYEGNMLDSNGKQYCLVYCNKSVPPTVTQIISLAMGYVVLTSSDDLEAKYITMRKINYSGQ